MHLSSLRVLACCSLMLACPAVVAAPAASPDPDQDERLRELDQIEVQADPFDRSRDDLLQPVEVLNGAELDRRRANTLGETLNRELGVHNSFFGSGAGRPIIRGQEGARVQVLSDGVASQDVSTVSVDHAVTIDPFVSEQIEVIKGPAALLYGSSAVGGAVNVIDGRIPTQGSDDGLSGRAQIYGDSVADTLGAAARLDLGGLQSALLFHADAFYRDSGNYRIPGFASLESDDDEPRGIVENSALRTQGGAIGFTVRADEGHFGVSLSRFDTLYGIPGHDHAHEEGESGERVNRLKGDADAEEGPVRIDLAQSRLDTEAAWVTGLAWLQSVRIRAGHTDYKHVELEGEETGTRFDNRQSDLRMDAEHAPIGPWRGVYGLAWSDRDFSAVGEEAFVPPNQTRTNALFLIETGKFGNWNVEAGLRWEQQRIDVAASNDRKHYAFSYSLAGRYQFNDHWSGLLRFDRAQRVPGAEELYSDGPHVATATYELGDVDLSEETSQQFEVGVHYDADILHWELNLFHNRFDDFIYLADTGVELEDLPARQWSQADARFTGLEGLVRYHLGETRVGHFDLTARFDQVRARLEEGGDLPRISPTRFGLGLDWLHNEWSGGIELLRVAAQDRVADFETRTDGYTTLSADLSYGFEWAAKEFEVFVQGRNLTDEQARVHTSLIKDRAPLPGRNLAFGVRSFF